MQFVAFRRDASCQTGQALDREEGAASARTRSGRKGESLSPSPVWTLNNERILLNKLVDDQELSTERPYSSLLHPSTTDKPRQDDARSCGDNKGLLLHFNANITFLTCLYSSSGSPDIIHSNRLNAQSWSRRSL